MGSVQLVGMSMDELQDAFKIRTVTLGRRRDHGVQLPAGHRRQHPPRVQHDPTSPTGYSGDGAPTGRYIAPASSPSCIAIYAGDCGAARQVLLLGPCSRASTCASTSASRSAAKANFEFGLEMLNVFDNINFNHTPTPGGAARHDFQVTTAYTDINTTADPGGRIGQFCGASTGRARGACEEGHPFRSGERRDVQAFCLHAWCGWGPTPARSRGAPPPRDERASGAVAADNGCVRECNSGNRPEASRLITSRPLAA